MKDRQAIEWLLGQLPVLVDGGVLTPAAADALRAHYQNAGKSERPRNFAVIICAILGGTLIGAGIILLVAHNWADLGRAARTAISLLPLAIGGALSGWSMFRKPASPAFNESAGIFHTLAIGASISLVSQTYHILGDLSAFILTWSLLALPLIYLLRSVTVALCYVAAIAFWAESRVDNQEGMIGYWLLLAATMPFYLSLLRANRRSLSANWLSAVIALSAALAVGFQSKDVIESTWILLYGGYFATLYMIERRWFQTGAVVRLGHPFRVIGAMGIVVLAVLGGYEFAWHHPIRRELFTGHAAIELALNFVCVAAPVFLAFQCRRAEKDFNGFVAGFPIAAFVAMSLGNHGGVVFLMNAYGAVLAVGTIFRGFHHDRMGTLNAGLLIAAALIIARFFDSEFTLLARAMAFILVGAGFLAANWFLLRKRSSFIP